MWKNLSNGETDGLVIMYMKNKKLHAVGLTQEQASLLDLSIAVPFVDSKIYVGGKITIENGVVKS